MGLGPVEVGTTSDQCPTSDVATVSFAWSYSFPICVLLFLLVISVCMFYEWKMLKQQGRELLSAQMQVADHYEFAAGLDARLTSLENTTDELSSHVSLMEGELHDEVNTLDTSIQCLRYGLMEYGGFVRNEELSSEQRHHMFVQERGNYVLWQMKTRADTTDENPNRPSNSP